MEHVQFTIQSRTSPWTHDRIVAGMEDPHEVGAARHEGLAQVQDRLAMKNQKRAIPIDEVDRWLETDAILCFH